VSPLDVTSLNRRRPLSIDILETFPFATGDNVDVCAVLFCGRACKVSIELLKFCSTLSRSVSVWLALRRESCAYLSTVLGVRWQRSLYRKLSLTMLLCRAVRRHTVDPSRFFRCGTQFNSFTL
jgi:hypothetical protein